MKLSIHISSEMKPNTTVIAFRYREMILKTENWLSEIKARDLDYNWFHQDDATSHTGQTILF